MHAERRRWGSIVKTNALFFFSNSGWHVGLPVVFWKSPDVTPMLVRVWPLLGAGEEGGGSMLGKIDVGSPCFPTRLSPRSALLPARGEKGLLNTSATNSVNLVQPTPNPPPPCYVTVHPSLSFYIDLLSNWLSFKLWYVWQLRTCNKLNDGHFG